MKRDVPQVSARDVYGNFVRDVTEVDRECGEVWRVQATHAAFPESEEVDRRFVNAGGASFGPVQMDTKPGDHEEEIYSGKREMNDVASDQRQPRFPSARCGPWPRAESVISHDCQRRPSAHSVESKHATDR